LTQFIFDTLGFAILQVIQDKIELLDDKLIISLLLNMFCSP